MTIKSALFKGRPRPNLRTAGQMGQAILHSIELTWGLEISNWNYFRVLSARWSRKLFWRVDITQTIFCSLSNQRQLCFLSILRIQPTHVENNFSGKAERQAAPPPNAPPHPGTFWFLHLFWGPASILPSSSPSRNTPINQTILPPVTPARDSSKQLDQRRVSWVCWKCLWFSFHHLIQFLPQRRQVALLQLLRIFLVATGRAWQSYTCRHCFGNGLLFSFFLMSGCTRFPRYLRHLGARTFHFACHLQHFGAGAFRFACSNLEPDLSFSHAIYLQHFGAGTFLFACYLHHFGAETFHLACQLQHLGTGTHDFALYFHICSILELESSIWHVSWLLVVVC